MSDATLVHESIPDFYRAFPFPNLSQDRDPAYLTSFVDRVSTHLPATLDGLWLEAGCGTGEYLALVAKRFPRARFVGVDLSSQSLAIAQRNLTAAGVSARVRLIEGDVFDPAVLDELGSKVAVVSACGSLHLVPNLHRLLPRLVATLRPGGVMVFGVYGLHGRWRLEQLRQACFTLVPDAGGYADRARLIQEALRPQYERLPAYQQLLATFGRPDAIPSQWWQDTFLAPYERQFDAVEVFDLLEASGCEDLCWMDEPPVETLLPREWCSRWQSLPRREQIRVLDILWETPFVWFVGKARG